MIEKEFVLDYIQDNFPNNAFDLQSVQSSASSSLMGVGNNVLFFGYFSDVVVVFNEVVGVHNFDVSSNPFFFTKLDDVSFDFSAIQFVGYQIVFSQHIY